MSGGEKFSKLDLSHAYQQIELDEDSRQYVTINTHKGLVHLQQIAVWSSLRPLNLTTSDGSRPQRNPWYVCLHG